MEELLAEVFRGAKSNEEKIGNDLMDALSLTIEKENIVGICDKCGKQLRIIHMRGGKQFIGCYGYPSCKNTYPLPTGAGIKPLEKACSTCGKPMIRVMRRGKRSFDMCIDPACPSKANWGKKGEKAASASRKSG